MKREDGRSPNAPAASAGERIRWGAGRLGRVIVARLAPGCDLKASIEEVVEKAGIEYGVILGGAASLDRAVLRNVRFPVAAWPITDDIRIFGQAQGPLELLAISGNISRTEEGKAWVHGHITVSVGLPDGLALGGHLVDGTIVLSTGEIAVVEVLGLAIERRHDPETRTKELYFSPRGG